MKPNFKNILLIALLGTTSCINEHISSGYDEDGMVTFTCSLGSAGGSEALHPSSRAAGNTWGVGDKVGVYMFSAADGFTANYPYTTTNTVEATSVGLRPYAMPLYYPAGRDEVTFMAYYPYMEAVSNETNRDSYPVDVSTPVDTPQQLKAIDLLYADGTDPETGNDMEYNSQSGPVSLIFKHKLSRLIITAEAPGSGFADSKLLISGMPTTGTFSLYTGTLSYLGGVNKTITAVPTTAGSGSATWEAIVVPHGSSTLAVGDTRTFTLTLGQSAYTFTVPSTHTYRTGMEYEYRLKLVGKEVVMLQNIIRPWGEAATDEDYTLSIDTDAFALDCLGRNTVPDAPLQVNFLGPEGFDGKMQITQAKITPSTSVNPEDASAQTPNWLNAVLKYGTSITFSTTQNATATARTGYLHIKAKYAYVSGGDALIGQEMEQEKTFTIKVEQEPVPTYQNASNCYLLAPGSEIFIPVSRVAQYVEKSGDTAGAIGADDAFTTELLWTDNNALIAHHQPFHRGADGALYVAVAPGQYGNAGIAVKVDGVIKWSWHIWVPQIDDVANIKTASGLMDRNLGAITNGATAETQAQVSTLGLLYQWGRKDPFPGSASATENIHPTWWNGDGMGGLMVGRGTGVMATDVAASVRQPMTFFLGDWRSGSWYTDGTDVYNPCPEGYKVPSKLFLGEKLIGTAIADAGWLSWNSGYTNADYGGYYPAAGSRLSTSGNLVSVDLSGIYWTTLYYNSEKADYAYLSSTAVGGSDYNNRTSGFLVRCQAVE